MPEQRDADQATSPTRDPASLEVRRATPAEQAAAETLHLEAMVDSFVEAVAAPDLDEEELERRIGEIDALGEREMIATAEMARRFAAGSLDEGFVVGSGSQLSRDLAELRRIAEELDPARHDMTRRRGLLRFGSRTEPLERYVARYADAERRLRPIVASLLEGRAMLEREGALVDAQRRSIGLEIDLLREYVSLAERLDLALEERLALVERSDPDRARRLREDLLFTVRRRRQDLLTQLAVALQGFAALEIVADNNAALVRAIRTATATTLAAMRTAAVVARALAVQHRGARQLELAGDASAAMADDASFLLEEHRDQLASGAAQAGQAAAASGESKGAAPDSLAALRRAWVDVFAALDSVEACRREARQAVAAGRPGDG